MVTIPGEIIALLTFPGVIVHELAHQIFCLLMKVPVIEVKYFRFANPCGYVVHDATKDPKKNFFISAGPFIVNNILGIIITFPIMLEYVSFGASSQGGIQANVILVINIIMMWIGFSILVHSFPSKQDAKIMVERVMKNPDVSKAAKFFAAPIIGISYIGSVGGAAWLDFIYAIAVSCVFPLLIVYVF